MNATVHLRPRVGTPLLVALLAQMMLGSLPAFAHELRPAYLELQEGPPGEFAVLWKTPVRGNVPLALEPQFSGRTESLTTPVTRQTVDAAVRTWRLKSIDPLRGQSLRIDGLEATMTDALVRVQFADGTLWTQRFTGGQPQASIPERESAFTVATVYGRLGVEHILTGADHLLFMLALLILTGGGWKLVKTITAFTVSHTITLTAASLGFVHVPQRPVEAVIALSIVFVAAEIVHGYRGRTGLTGRAPWVVAFAFGLLHGLGFAGALSEVGLPAGHIPTALLFFSAGVETGHLVFVAQVLMLDSFRRRVVGSVPRWLELAPPYAIGSVAMYWVIERVTKF